MKYLLLVAALLMSCSAQAYSGNELREDCQAAEENFTQLKKSDPYHSLRASRCMSYVAGFVDSYAVSEYLAGQVGIKLNAYCLPAGPDLSMRLVRAVLLHVDRIPPNSTTSTATLVAGALAKTFPCTDSLESKK